jgi:hypothetical protein
MAKILPNWKIFATDIDKYIPILINGEYKKYYIQDDDSFIDRSSLKILDGDYYKLYYEENTYKLFCGSELDHAYLIPEREKQQVLTVSSNISSNIEFDYSLSSPRQNFYVLSAEVSSLKTTPSIDNSNFLVDSTMNYSIMDSSSTEGLNAINEYIKYKSNYKVYVIDDDDRILDYLESTGNINLTQTDIRLSTSKDNKNIPIYTRQIPWYIIIYPTNRHDYNLFNSKSKITKFDEYGNIERSLRCNSSIASDFNKSNLEDFVQYKNTYVNNLETARGDVDSQGLFSYISSGSDIYHKGYRVDDSIGSAVEKKPVRNKTSFRLVKEIIEELDDNYIVELNGIGKSVTTFDVFSRLNLKQFYSLLRLENFNIIFNKLSNGIIRDVKIASPIKNSNNQLSDYNTQLLKRKSSALPDTFTSIKKTSDNYYITPPTNTDPPSRTR